MKYVFLSIYTTLVMRIRMNYTYPEIFHTNPDPRNKKYLQFFPTKLTSPKKDLQSPVRCHFENHM